MVTYNIENKEFITKPPDFKNSMCGLNIFVIGATITFTPLGILVIVTALFILPYLIACLASYFVKRK
ncbi:hypothetical protein HYS31_04090 [Candidatus Woesearchaeota archaeon]|nr:hypothetical protein [Candidatus Woesearchaeota archaeon]